MIRTILLTGVFLLMATVASGEFYQYTDEAGNPRFTDDMSQIPESQRVSVEKFASETSPTMETPDASSPGISEGREEAVPPEASEAGVDYGDESFEMRAVDLNKIQTELAKTRESLKEERAEIEAGAPGENAKSSEIIAYSMKVDALNAKIDRYGKDLKAFEEKVEAFNKRGKTKAE